MPILTFSLTHHTTPIAVREQAAIPAEQHGQAGLRLRDAAHADGCLIVSTCNRTDITLSAAQAPSSESVADWLASERGMAAKTLAQHAAALHDTDAVRHAFRVAAGLDSMVLGEPQILGQVKAAASEQTEALDPVLQRLCQSAFAAAKAARSQTGIGEHPVSFAFAGVRLAERIFDDLASQTVLLVGAGEMIELFARHLRRQGVRRLMFANRTLARAEALAHAHEGAAIPLSRLADYLPEADMVVTSTASETPVLTADDFRAAVRARKRKPMCVIDMAVPRDVAPDTGKLSDVFLYTVDDLKTVIETNQQARREAAAQAEAIVDEHVGGFMQWLTARDAASTIRGLRARAADDAAPLMARARTQLAAGADPDAVLRTLTRSLNNKLLHGPTSALRAAPADSQADLLDATRTLFGLGAIDSTEAPSQPVQRPNQNPEQHQGPATPDDTENTES